MQQTGKSLAFEEGEYHLRLQRLRSAMHAGELDAVIIFGQDQMYYFTGYDQIGYSYYQALVVSAEERPVTYLCREVDAHIVRVTSIADDVRVWFDDDPNDPTELTARILAESGSLAGRRIGLDTASHALLPVFYDRLRQHLAPAEIVHASDLITDLRLEKSAAEVACMREAARLYDIGASAGFAAMGAGVRECEVHAAVVNALYSNGGEFMSVSPTLESGPRTLYQTHGAALRREMCLGDPVTLEIGACYRRYHAVAMRSIAIGKPGQSQLRLHGMIDEAVAAGLEVIRPGVAVSQVAATMNRVFEGYGIDRSTRHSGYGIGIGYPPTWLDNLRVKVTDEHILKPGMTFILHSVLADQDAGVGVALGDPVLVTEDGVERLTGISRELVVVK